MRIGNGEVQRFSELVGDIYDASLDRALWASLIDRIGAYLGGKSATLGSQDNARMAVDVHYSSGITDEYLQSYADIYFKLNPIFPTALFFGVAETHGVPDVLPCEEFCRTRFFQEWMLPQGFIDGLFATLDKSATGCALFIAMRHMTDGQVDDQMRWRFSALVPHIRRALLIGNIIDLHKGETAALADMVDGIAASVFLLDATGHITYANTSGHHLLNDGRCLSAPGGRLTASNPEASRSLEELLTAALVGDHSAAAQGIAVPLRSRDGERYVAHALPLTAGARRKAGTPYAAVAAVFVRRTEVKLLSPFEAIAQDFGLTPAELRVLLAIVDIGGVREVAPVLGISEATVKTHLQHLFEKTMTSRQADLVKIVAGYMSPLTIQPATTTPPPIN